MKKREENISVTEVRSQKSEVRTQSSSVLNEQCLFAVISTKREERSVTSKLHCGRFLATFEMTCTKKPKAESLELIANFSLLTIKYNNSPSRRASSTIKTSHLSSLKLAGGREQRQLLFFLSPIGGVGGGFTNNLKQKYAYET
jgi:hypothetical protein